MFAQLDDWTRISSEEQGIVARFLQNPRIPTCNTRFCTPYTHNWPTNMEISPAKTMCRSVHCVDSSCATTYYNALATSCPILLLPKMKTKAMYVKDQQADDVAKATPTPPIASSPLAGAFLPETKLNTPSQDAVTQPQHPPQPPAVTKTTTLSEGSNLVEATPAPQAKPESKASSPQQREEAKNEANSKEPTAVSESVTDGPTKVGSPYPVAAIEDAAKATPTTAEETKMDKADDDKNIKEHNPTPAEKVDTQPLAMLVEKEEN